jgi:hypothetical protein
VQVLGSKNSVEIEIDASERLVPQSQVLTGPDRLVIDFPNAVPGGQLRNLPVHRGEVEDVRVGLFRANPPITRVVLDLKSPQSFQVFPYGRTVIVKVAGRPLEAAGGVDNFPSERRADLVSASFNAGVEQATSPAAPLPRLQVTYHDGLLAIRANRANLSELLLAVHERTGADIAIAAGAEQERVAADIGPAPAPEVLAHLLNGSRFNFVILSSPDDPRALERVILSPRSVGGPLPLPPMPVNTQDDAPTRAAAPVEDVVPPQAGQEPNQLAAPVEADDTRN